MDDTIKYRGHTIEILPDETPFDPRENDNLGIMAFFHKRYTIGDSSHDMSASDFSGWDEMESYIRHKLGGVLIMPVYMYDHSGITISTRYEYPYNDHWDAGQIGFIFTTKAKIRETYMKKHLTKKTFDRAKALLLIEIDEYDKYLRGEVYGYVIKNKQGFEVESCWGYTGDEWAMKDAKATVDCIKDGPKPNRSAVRQENAKKQLRDSKGRFIPNVVSVHRYNFRDKKGRFIKQPE